MQIKERFFVVYDTTQTSVRFICNLLKKKGILNMTWTDKINTLDYYFKVI